MPEIFFVENPVGADGSGGRFELADPPNVATRDPAWWEEGELGTGDRVGPGCRTEKLEGSSAPRPWKSPHTLKRLARIQVECRPKPLVFSYAALSNRYMAEGSWRVISGQ